MRGELARKAFAKGVKQFLSEVYDGRPRKGRSFGMMSLLATDQRADSIWNAFGGGEAATQSFMWAVSRALSDFHVHDAALERSREREFKLYQDSLLAIDVLLRCCPTVFELPSEHFEKDLRSLASSIREREAHSRWLDDAVPPRLREKKGKGTDPRCTHFARILVARMVQHFGRPYYQQVASAINVMLELPPDGEGMTKKGVRAAWRKLPPTFKRRFEAELKAGDEPTVQEMISSLFLLRGFYKEGIYFVEAGTKRPTSAVSDLTAIVSFVVENRRGKVLKPAAIRSTIARYLPPEGGPFEAKIPAE
jgi:hypothetical protein